MPCQATTKRGRPCQAPAGPDGYCFWHSPARAAERAQARRKGGQARHGRAVRHITEDTPPTALQTPEDALTVLEHALGVALALEPSHAQVRALTSLALAALRVHEAGELEQRLAALEARLTLGGTP